MGFSMNKHMAKQMKSKYFAYQEISGKNVSMTQDTTPRTYKVESLNPYTNHNAYVQEGKDDFLLTEDSTVISQDIKLEHLDSLINDLSNCKESFEEVPSRALRVLFALSENHESFEMNRIKMVRNSNGRLVPTIIKFLQRCKPNSSEQYLALLVLNNISIPLENKGIIAIDNKGAYILSRMLCCYPNCSLIAIILVNLSFCESSLRMKLVGKNSDIQLVEAFTFALKISMQSERSTLQSIPHTETGPVDCLRDLNIQEVAFMGEEYLRSPFNPKSISYPESARWCLCGIQNLSRPAKDPNAVQTLVKCGALDVILRVLTVDEICMHQGYSYCDQSSNDIHGDVLRNDPYIWGPNSMQDAALYTLMNLAISPVIRDDLRKTDVAHKLATIARYSTSPDEKTNTPSPDEEGQKNMQCLKARMALSFLFGSEGHFGQDGSSNFEYQEDDLIVKGLEAPLLVELLSNVVHGRGKKNPGGYSPTMFNPKKVLFAIRCLLTNRTNVKTFFVSCGVKLNILLLKVIALHSIQNASTLDVEAAEDACFSLYLLSTHGFTAPFLPPQDDGYPFEKVLIAYLKNTNCSQAGKHAAKQLLLRYPYLNFSGSINDDEPKVLKKSDLVLDSSLIKAIDKVLFENEIKGEEPLDDIFGRPMLRYNIRSKNGKRPTPWSIDESDEAVSFNSALDAIKSFSYGSKFVQHVIDIDDIKLANDIAKCANGERAKAYGFRWAWQDGGGALKEEDVRQKLNDFRTGKIESIKGILKNVGRLERPNEPISIFGIKCGFHSIIHE